MATSQNHLQSQLFTAAKHVQKEDAMGAVAAISSFAAPARYVSSLMLQALWGAYEHPAQGLYDLSYSMLASLRDTEKHLSGHYFLSTTFMEFWLRNVEAELPSFMIDQTLRIGDRPWSHWYHWLIPASMTRQDEPSEIERLKDLIDSLPWQQARVQAVSLARLAVRCLKHDRIAEAESFLDEAIELACPDDSYDFVADGAEEAEALSEVARIVVEGPVSASSAMVEKLYRKLCVHCGEWSPKGGRMFGGYEALRAAATRACKDEDPAWTKQALRLFERIEYGSPDALNHLQVWAALQCSRAENPNAIEAATAINAECARWLLENPFEAKKRLIEQLTDNKALSEASRAWLHWVEYAHSWKKLEPHGLESLNPERLDDNLLLRLYGHQERAKRTISIRDREPLVKWLFELGVSNAAWQACDEIEDVVSRRRASVFYAPKRMSDERWTQTLELGMEAPPPSDFEMELLAQKVSVQTPAWVLKTLLSQAEAHSEPTARCRTLSVVAAALGGRYALDRVPEVIGKLLVHLEQMESHFIWDPTEQD